MELKIDKSTWKKVKLGEVAFEYSKRINNPSQSEFDRFVGSSNINQWDFRVRSWESTDSVTSAMKLFEMDDYLLVRRSLYASDFRERAPRAHFSGVCSGDILTIRENPDLIADGFLIGIFNSPNLWKYVVANASGSITRRIKWKDLANYEFLLPPKAEQARLAELLWAMDEVIERDKMLLHSIKEYSVSFREKIVVESSQFIRLEKLIWGITAGKSVNGVNKPASSEEKGVLKVSAVGPNGFDPNENKTITNQTDYDERFAVWKEDVLITRANTSELVGRVCLVPDNYPNQMLCDKTLRLECHSGVDKNFLVTALSSRLIRNQIEGFATGTGGAMKNISQAEIRSLKIPSKSSIEQKSLGDNIKAVNDRIELISYKVKASQALQNSLINHIF